MEGKRLMERIRDMEKNPTRRGDSEVAPLQESILRHLQSILNTRQGSAIIGQEFGVPDFSALIASSNPSDIVLIERGIEEVIRRYERRLKNVGVHFHPDPKQPTSLAFRMEGELVGGREDAPLRFVTVLSSTGQITIKKQ